MNRYAKIVALLALAATFTTCQRDEYPGERGKKPITREQMPTPVKSTQVAAAPAAPVPPASPPAEKPAPTLKPEAAAPPAAPAPPAVPAAAPSGAGRVGYVNKGVDILDSPSATAEVLGTFQGRTKITVEEEQGQYARVKAPTTGGSSVEGWVLASSVKAPGEGAPAAEAKAAKTAPETKTAAAAPAAGAKAAAPAAAPAKAAPAAPAKAAGGGGKGNGPDDISLKAIAGMTMKRAAVPFTHKKHYADYSVKCDDCHHPVKAKGGAVPATKACTDAGCHQEASCNGAAVPAKNKACPNFEDAYHFNCIECHRAQSGPTKCAECHSG
jgi:class III cytochrome C family protein